MQDPMRHQFIVMARRANEGGVRVAEQVAFNVDCMEYMRTLPDKAFDLAVVDPPYGGGGTALQVKNGLVGTSTSIGPISRTGGKWATKYGKKIIAWDNAPDKEYFDELFRVSKQQIIWGGNYFSLPPCRCFLIWEKTNIPENFTMAQCEYAWTNFKDNAKIFKHTSIRAKDEGHFHPTEKPVSLYAWIYQKYAKPDDKILDTHLGSGSSRIAAYDAGLDFVGTEIDVEYFRLQEERWAAYTAQIRMW